ncbi:heparinase II/III family protein [Achromobacter sp. RTa]|uniref:heparinase II/III domain-containing protein n=1 Tax=Achromobacter sp. RTa TaxID=1532557 RepID=UPI000AFACB0A|nr:heparinase II/III family protein [Achromobacter sp. RTa]
MKILRAAVFGGLYLDIDLRRSIEIQAGIAVLPNAARSSILVYDAACRRPNGQQTIRVPAVSERVDSIIQTDLCGNWFKQIRKYQPEIILFDLTAEWYSIVQDSNGLLYTTSPEFRKHVKPLLAEQALSTVIEDEKGWDQALRRIRAELAANDLLDKIILVELRSAERGASGSPHFNIYSTLERKYAVARQVFSEQKFIVHHIATNDLIANDSPVNPFEIPDRNRPEFITLLRTAVTEGNGSTAPENSQMPAPPLLPKQSFDSYIAGRTTTQPSPISIAAAEELIENGTLRIAGFADFHYSLPLLWNADPFHNRTWKWYVHQLVFIPWLIAHSKQAPESNALSFAVSAVFSWWEFASENPEAEDIWHDHGTALRARNILDLLIALKIRTASSQEISIARLESVLAEHQKKLSVTSFYSRHTNHGFDQALVLVEISVYFIHRQGQDRQYLDLALSRLEDEISHAFATDGGHVENSPGYLVYGLKQALEAQNAIRKLLGSSSDFGMERERFTAALSALAYSVRPDGKLPHIGDTADFIVKDFLRRDPSSEYQNFLYSISGGTRGRAPEALSKVLPVSGWAMVRSEHSDATSFRSSVHIVFKCGFLSTYHRHDDDLSFVLFGAGEDWIVDGGLYKHAPTDPFRVYARSHNAHSLASPIHARVSRRLPQPKSAPRILQHNDDNKVFSITAETHMFEGFESVRSLTYDRAAAEIVLSDRVSPLTSKAAESVTQAEKDGNGIYRQRFIVPTDKKVEQNESGDIYIFSRKTGNRLILSQLNKNCPMQRVISIGTDAPTLGAWRSTVPGKIEPAYAIDFISFSQEMLSEILIRIDFNKQS